MKVLCDEHVPPALANALRGEGFVVGTVADECGVGTDDDDVLAYAAKHGHVVLTNDSDFVGSYAGVLYFDDQQASRRDLVRAIRTVDDLLPDDELLSGTFFVPGGWI